MSWFVGMVDNVGLKSTAHYERGGSSPSTRTKYCVVAELVQQAIVNREIGGSSPSHAAKFPPVAQWLEQWTYKP